ncbi:hypothetical protein TWF506_009920 [Arthrobotrys conoides]|uniref:CFEM domain-containing protein n=1 Tax=Arthrobotrys conoides TaxID=74498 RepID=A0AAN8NG85_9PEZI
MKAVLALTASISLASAALLPRQLDQIPSCALSCAIASLGSAGCGTSSAPDIACVCRAESFITSLVPCVQAGCSADQFQATLQAATVLCQDAGVELNIPTGETSGAPSSVVETSSAPAATTSTETETETAAATTSAPSTETTGASTSAETSAGTTDAPSPTNAGNSTGTTTTRPPTATGTEPGAASRNTVALGGLGAIVALVAAFL